MIEYNISKGTLRIEDNAINPHLNEFDSSSGDVRRTSGESWLLGPLLTPPYNDGNDYFPSSPQMRETDEVYLARRVPWA
jgi:hypothetical protein